MSNYLLLIKVDEDAPQLVKDYYNNYKTNYDGDSGIDLIIPNNITIANTYESEKINHMVSCEMICNNKLVSGSVSYYMYPRSSLSKTPLMMANHVGIIDAGYRGPLIGCVRNLSYCAYRVEQGMKLFQICAPDLSPITVKVVTELSETKRGSNGFGSTNK
jgi:dUTP pyrophosphatase